MILIALILSSSFVVANITLVYPFQQQLTDNSSISINDIAAGEGFEITINNQTDYGESYWWDTLTVTEDSLPKGWVSEPSKIQGDQLTIRVKAWGSADEGPYSIKIKASSLSKVVRDEFLLVNVNVKNNLQKIGVKELNKQGIVNSPILFEFVIINNSNQEHSFILSSNLPNNWMKKQEVNVQANGSKTVIVEVLPLNYGETTFEFYADSKLNGKRKTFLKQRK